MNTIKFSHQYHKLRAINIGYPVKLLLVLAWHGDMSPDFVKYDASYPDGEYPLPDGKKLILIFEQYNRIFTTVRRWTPDKEAYYNSKVGEMFDIEMV